MRPHLQPAVSVFFSIVSLQQGLVVLAAVKDAVNRDLFCIYGKGNHGAFFVIGDAAQAGPHVIALVAAMGKGAQALAVAPQPQARKRLDKSSRLGVFSS
jgi:hypothetical protein